MTRGVEGVQALWARPWLRVWLTWAEVGRSGGHTEGHAHDGSRREKELGDAGTMADERSSMRKGIHNPLWTECGCPHHTSLYMKP